MKPISAHCTPPVDTFYQLQLEIQEKQPTFGIVTVIVPSFFVDTIYKEAALAQKKEAQPYGFNRESIPIEYIKHNYQSNLLEHTKEFIFKFLVTSFLYKELRTRKFLFAGEPRLKQVEMQIHQDARFTFELTFFPPIYINEWKYFPFKAPRRKKYKDLDKQVESFIKEERKHIKDDISVSIGDWINFDIAFVDKDDYPLLGNYKENIWLKIGDEEVDDILHVDFIGKKIGDNFYTTNRSLQEFFNDQIDTHYNFNVTIIDIIPHAFFCFEQLKRYFKLKTNKDLHQKLIEVFSYRNDLSQRRTTVEETLKLLLNKHRFSVPRYLSLRQQKIILNAMHRNPDYHVYKLQKDFNDQVQQLAEKQVKEMLLIDQLAYHENVSATHNDIKMYLNLIKRPRTKEFIYFNPPETKIMGQEVPIITEELKQQCLREKTLNYIIYHLTQK